MLKKILTPIVILGMLFFVQCTDDPPTPDQGQGMYKGGGNGHGGGGGSGGGNGGGNGDGTGGNGGSGGENGGGGSGNYGDLVICLRTANGIPEYVAINGEQGVAYYPQPIMVEESTEEPLKVGDSYAVFEINAEGDVILDPTGEYVIKEVEFGRLNIVRAPQSVIDNALDEAVTSLTQPGITNITTDASGRLIAIIGDEDWNVNYDDTDANDEFNDKTIDSPRENVALYQELMSNGLDGVLSFLTNYGYTEDDVLTLAAGTIAAGADKTGNIIVDEMAYMNNWLIRWSDTDHELSNSPDVNGKHYYDYSSFSYNR